MKKVLVVDDDPINRKVAREALSIYSHEVIEAKNGEESIIMAKKLVPDVILMDIQMPGINGTEAMKKIREQPGLNKIPIIAITAYAMKGDREKLLNEGFSGYISKPVSIRELLKLVESL